MSLYAIIALILIAMPVIVQAIRAYQSLCAVKNQSKNIDIKEKLKE